MLYKTTGEGYSLGKRTLGIFGIIIVCLAAGSYLITKTISEGATGESEENTEVDSNKSSNDNGEENDSTSKDQGEVLQDLMDESKQFPEDYVTAGEECKAIKDTLERGDCFQDTNKNHLDWYMNTEKEDFYFSYQHNQDQWNNVFYYSIDEDDELDTLYETDYFNTYMDDLDSNDIQLNHIKDTVNENWYVFSGIIPKEYRQDLKYVYLTDTGKDFVFAVGRHEDEPSDQTFMFSHNMTEYIPYYKSTFIHEFGHVLTLNEQQVDIDEDAYSSENEELHDKKEAACDTYYEWGCMKENSYLYEYYLAFWEDISDAYESIDWKDETDYTEFFYENEDRFMNSYQGTSPVEDIADAFSQFVMSNSQDIEKHDELKYDKLRFFYDYEELVELRTDILENLYDLSVTDEILY